MKIVKMMEQIGLETVSRQIMDMKVIRNSSHGLTKGKPCLNRLIIYNEMSVLVDEGTAVDIVYLDVSKAFNTVSPKFLVKKLMRYGLNEHTAWWTEN